MLERSVLRVRGFAEPRLAKFATILWMGSEEGFVATSFNPGISPIELNRRQEIPVVFRWRINGSNPVSFEITKDSPDAGPANIAPR